MSLRRWFTFSYGLQRDFRLPYFHRSVLVVLLALLCLFTTFNIATNGYDIQTVNTLDPNATLSKSHWFLNPIFTLGDDKLNPRCQPERLAIGSEQVTTNFGTAYAIQSVVDALGAQQPSLPYLNSTLQECDVRQILISMSKSVGPNGDALFDWGPSYARAEIHCQVETEAGTFALTLESTLGSDQKKQLIHNITTHASTWWGRELLDNYIRGMQMAAARGTRPIPSRISMATIIYHRLNVSSLDRDEMFNISYNILSGDGDSGPGWNSGPFGEQGQTVLFNNDTFEFSHLITEGLALAKMYYCFLQVDLGEERQPNYLLDPVLLQSVLSESPFNFNRYGDGPLNETGSFVWAMYNGISYPGSRAGWIPLHQSYDTFHNISGPLGTRKARISSRYTCLTPTRKSISTIVWTTLLANFVLIQATYKLIMFVAENIVAGRDPTAMHCDGCLAQGIALKTVVTSTPASGGSVKPSSVRSGTSTYTLLQETGTF